MNRWGIAVCLIAVELAVSSSITGCGTPGKSLKMINNTSVTVTLQSCPDIAAQAQQCSAAAKVAPNGSGAFPLSSPSAGIKLVVITGYDGQTRCFIVPATNLP